MNQPFNLLRKTGKKKLFFILIFSVILIAGFLLRSYSFSDWLHFQLDQSRDAALLSYANENGTENLPLLGPRAGGSFLRLGPIFYYFEFISAKIFGFSPASLAYVSLFFGTLTIPVFYFFVRNYFKQKFSLALTVLIAASFYMVMYSRFAWNPNPLPFFGILTFLATLKTIDSENKNKGLWLIILAISLAIAGQLHFLAFVGFPTAVFLIFVIKRPRIKLRYWIFAFLAIGLLYSPAIINDVMTGGKNAEQFLEATLQKTAKADREERSLGEKFIRNIREHAFYSGVVLSGYTRIGLPKSEKINLTTFDFKCRHECQIKYLLGLGITSFIFFVLSIIILTKRYVQEKAVRKKNFLLVCMIWFFVSFFFFIPLSFDLAPRFFLVSAPLFFIFFGLILLEIEEKIPGRNKGLLLFVAVLILTSFNLYLLSQRFSQLKKAPFEAFNIGLNKIPKEHHRVTLQQQNMIIDSIEKQYKQDGLAVFINSEPFYERAFFFHLDQKKIPRDGFDTNDQVYEKSNYYMILPVFSNTKEELKKVQDNLELKNTVSFGTLNLYHFKPINTPGIQKNPLEMIREDEKTRNPLKESGSTPQRYSWREFWDLLKK
ncbi:MAG: glycosyltransferase family 39 protein [Candidatus Moraniibacteriota bacterium]